MATYGYVRKNFPTSEVEQLTKLLTYNCDELFFEGKSLLETSELKAMIEKLEKNDLVVVTHLHVFGQELQHLRPVISFFQENGIRLISIDDQVDTNRDSFFYPLFDIFSKMDADCREELENNNT
ncbi:recombinase family protein [Vagococcus salmoninarum]|uniref:Resolvase/invertase-type recombinase catalytic domain-containing protein n=1 Tax=Vagococcus salmoninarum TaxID=2739 RepID=A0A429ZGN0_9ENTE|nr:recombinase family protein [Vagococcus salmoninarum]RST92794.1 hypothetical protein CBF35_12795 [Vagococcus salmoninarum]